MATTFAEPGGDSTFILNVAGSLDNFWGGTNANPYLATDFVHGGHKKSIGYNPNTQDWVSAPDSVVSDAGGRVSIYFYLNAFPTDGNARIFRFLTNSSGNLLSIKVKSSGSHNIQIFDDAGSQIGSDGDAVTLNTWHRLSIAFTFASVSSNEFRIWLDSHLSNSISNYTFGSNGYNKFQIGNPGQDSTMDLRSSDHYVDSDTSLTDTGDIWVTAKRPFANGSLNEFITQIGSGGSGYGSGHAPQTNERPITVTNGWSLDNTTLATEEYTAETAAAGDINCAGKTIVDIVGWVYAKRASNANTPVHHIIVGGVAILKALTTNNQLQWVFSGQTVYPGGNTDIGLDAQYTTVSHLTSLFDCGLMIIFIGPPTTTNIGTVNGLAVGSVGTFNGLAMGSVGTINGLA